MTKKKNKSMIQRRLIPTYIFLAIEKKKKVFGIGIPVLLDDHGRFPEMTMLDISRGKLTFWYSST
ncbi:MAG: hypothetical protein ACLTDV_04760 [Eubacterium sp.]